MIRWRILATLFALTTAAVALLWVRGYSYVDGLWWAGSVEPRVTSFGGSVSFEVSDRRERPRHQDGHFHWASQALQAPSTAPSPPELPLLGETMNSSFMGVRLRTG